MPANQLRGALLACSLAAVACAAIAEYWIPVSLSGVVAGVVYATLSAEVYSGIVHGLAAQDRRVTTGALIPLIVKLNLLAAFVYLLTVSSTLFIYSSLFGLLVIVPASFWAWRRQE